MKYVVAVSKGRFWDWLRDNRTAQPWEVYHYVASVRDIEGAKMVPTDVIWVPGWELRPDSQEIEATIRRNLTKTKREWSKRDVAEFNARFGERGESGVNAPRFWEDTVRSRKITTDMPTFDLPKPPPVVRVGHLDFTVRYDSPAVRAHEAQHQVQIAGYTNMQSQEIVLADVGADGTKLHEQYKQTTLLHEVLHAALEASGYQLEDEEEVISALQGPLLTALQNKWLVDALRYAETQE